MKNTLVLCLTAILFEVLSPAAILAITTEDIVSQLEQKEQSIKSIHGKFNVRAQNLMNDGNTVEIEEQYEWAKRDNIQKLIREYKSIPEKFEQKEPYKECPNCPNMIMRTAIEKEIRAFDGNVTKLFLPGSNSGRVYIGDQQLLLGKMPADWLLSRVKKKPLSAFLKEDCTFLKYVGDVNLEGRICHLLEFTTPKSNGKLYVTDEQGLVPVKYESNITNHKLSYNTRGEYIYCEFKHYGNITMPTKVIVNVYRVYPDREQLAIKEVFTVEQLEINKQIPDTEVLLQFPAGTHVHDSVTNKNYVVN
ncbi:MAG: hypothetical protein WCE45_01090 [Sedimentisphaerales bacterium]